MSRLKVDLGDVKLPGEFEPLPDGDYEVVVNGCKEGEGQKGPYLNWEFEVQDAPHKGRRLWRITSLTEAALPFLKELLFAAGVESGKGGFDTDEAVGKRLKVRLITESSVEYGDRNVIKRFMPLVSKAKVTAKAPYKTAGKRKGL